MDIDKSGDIDKEETFKFLGAFRRGHALNAMMNPVVMTTESIKFTEDDELDDDE